MSLTIRIHRSTFQTPDSQTRVPNYASYTRLPQSRCSDPRFLQSFTGLYSTSPIHGPVFPVTIQRPAFHIQASESRFPHPQSTASRSLSRCTDPRSPHLFDLHATGGRGWMAGAAAEQRGNSLKGFKDFYRKPNPESGPDCHICAMFTQQRIVNFGIVNFWHLLASGTRGKAGVWQYRKRFCLRDFPRSFLLESRVQFGDQPLQPTTVSVSTKCRRTRMLTKKGATATRRRSHLSASLKSGGFGDTGC